MRKDLVSLFFATFLCFLGNSLASDCPFAACMCQRSESGSVFDFDGLICESTGLPNLTAPAGTTYKVKIFIVRSADIGKIPDRYFASFSLISYLILSLNADRGYVKQTFAPGSLNGPKIMNITFEGIDGLIPPPDQLTNLGKAGLQMLGIVRHGPMALNRPHFAGFRKLASLIIWQSTITEIDEVVFNGIELSLEDLAFSNVGWKSFPDGLTAISKLLRLSSLDLSYNQIGTIPKDALTKNLFLSRIDLSGNPLKQQIESQSFDFPNFIKELALKNMGFESMPKILWRNALLSRLDLSQNAIKTLQRGAFSLAFRLTQLYLDSNPIQTIDSSAFDPLYLGYLNLVSLSNTNLQKLDLAIFTALGDNMTTLILDDNKKLTVIGLTSQQGKIPTNLQISARNTSLYVIDGRCSYLFQNSAKVKMDISDNKQLQCNSLNWMAPYVLNTKQVTANDAFCVGGLALKDYLNGLPDQTTGTASSSSTRPSTDKPSTPKPVTVSTPSGKDASTTPSSGVRTAAVSMMTATLVIGTIIRTILS